MDADTGLPWLTPRRRQILRLALLLSFFIWLFARPLREAVSMWVPFAAFAGLELHFFASGLLARRRVAEAEAPLGRLEEWELRSRDDVPAPHQRRGERDTVVVVDDVLARNLDDAGRDPFEPDGLGRDGDGGLLVRAWPFELAAAALVAAWLVIAEVRSVVPALLVLVAASLLGANLLARAFATPQRPGAQRHPGVIHLRQLALILLVAGAVFLMVRPTGWAALTPAQHLRGEQVFAREASRVASKPVAVQCDSAGSHTGVRNDADGAAIVGGRDAWLAPSICMTLYDQALRGRHDSFDRASWAVLVLAHEAWHLRGQANEGLANCFGLQSGVALGQRIGLSSGTAARMMRFQYDQSRAQFSLGRAEYQLPSECRSGGRYDLDPQLARFP